MKLITSLLLLTILTLSAAEPPMKHAKAISDYIEAINTHSWEKISPHMTDDAVFIFTEGTFVGKAAAKAAFEKTFAMIEGEQFSVHDVTWTAVSDSMASCHYEFRWKGRIAGEEASGGGRGTTILRKAGDRWLIAHEHLGPYPRK